MWLIYVNVTYDGGYTFKERYLISARCGSNESYVLSLMDSYVNQKSDYSSHEILSIAWLDMDIYELD